MLEAAVPPSTFTFPMAGDDDMEISSEHGHNPGDQDIDIDIDLTAGHVDEDYILEDANFNIDSGNDFQHQQSAVGHDDLMIDDDNQSYQMDDADLLQDDGLETAEPETMSFAIPATLTGTGGDAEPPHTMRSSLHDQTIMENEHVPEYNELQTLAEDHEDFAQHEDQLSFQVEEPLQLGGKQTIETTDNINDITPMQAPKSPLAQDELDAPNPTSDELSRKDSSSPHESAVSIPENAGSKAETHVEDERNETGSLVGAIVTASVQVESSSVNPMVSVTYRSVEYSLFSTSDSDDPDSYFLSDLSILEKPLSIFFQAIRDVIHEELSGEDELVLMVDDFGVEIQEISQPIQDVTLSQIVNLHERLLRNDGEAHLRPLHISLSVKPNFHKRLSNLVTGASAGKGLSELIIWEEHIESLVDSAEVDEQRDVDDVELSGQSLSNDDVGDEEATGQYDEDQSAVESTSSAGDVQQDESLEVTSTVGDDQFNLHAGNAEKAQIKSTPDKKLELVSAPVESGLETQKSDKNLDSSVDEDGDLIDYSEDEYEIEEQKQTSSSEAANDRTDKEYEQINEELRTRSRTRDHSEVANEATDSRRTLIADEKISAHETSAVQNSFANYEIEGQFEDGNAEEEEPSEATNDEWQHTTDGFTELAKGRSRDQEERDVEYDQDTAETDPFDRGAGAEYPVFTTTDGTADDDLEGHQNYSAANGEEYEYDKEPVEDDINYAFGEDVEEYTNQIGQLSPSGDEVQGDDADEFNVSFESRKPTKLQSGKDATFNSGEADSSDNLDNSATGSLNNVDTAESSVTLGADEIQYHDELDDGLLDDLTRVGGAQSLNQDSNLESAVTQKDEIDYEDDEEEAKSEPVSSSLAQSTEITKDFSPTNGKRSRAEVDLDDLSSFEGSNAKRPRS